MVRKNLLTVAFVAFGLMAIPAVTFASDKKEEAKKEEVKTEDKVAHISYADLKKAIEDKKVVLLDCNGDESYAKGHIPTALNCKAADVDAKLPADKTALVVAYCGSEKCTAWKGGASKLTKLGYTNVQHFAGGLKGWVDAGGTLEK
jgi:rhodanese-related sulfurtransferase